MTFNNEKAKKGNVNEEKLYSMYYNKSLIHILKVWTIAMLIAGIVFMIQEITIIFADENKYFSLLFDRESNLIILVITMIVTISLAFFVTSKFAKKIESVKNINFYYTVGRAITYVVSVFLVLIILTSVIDTFITANNIHSMSGKIDNVKKVSSKNDGEVMQRITVTDSDKEKQRFLVDNRIKNFNVNKGDKIKADYIPVKTDKNTDGRLLGFVSSSE
ncbi:hypothetical protein [Mycobacterium marinum]|uniref:hypothetical protein n=1 Tax=Mycobacterium marinum TaxID=1781 RepID=UPI003567F39F